MTDLIARLREAWSEINLRDYRGFTECDDAINEAIAEIERLREALEKISVEGEPLMEHDRWAVEIARKALKTPPARSA